MKTLRFLFFLILALVQISCTSKVHTRYNIKIPKTHEANQTGLSDTNTQIVIDQVQPERQIEPPKQISVPPPDTIVIDITENSDVELSRANELFVNKDYRNALQLYISYLNRHSMVRTNNYWIARLKTAECLYELNHPEQSVTELEEIRHSNNIPSNIMQRTYFLLHKIYCETNQKDKAEEILLDAKNLFKDTFLEEISPCKAE